MWQKTRIKKLGIEPSVENGIYLLKAECEFKLLLWNSKRSSKYMVYVFRAFCDNHNIEGEIRILTTDIPTVKLYEFDDRHSIILQKYFEQKNYKVETDLNYNVNILDNY